MSPLCNDFGHLCITCFVLEQNYANPFNPEPNIGFHIPKDGEVILHIYNTCGQNIRTLVKQKLEAGYHNVVWDGRDNFGKAVSTETFFYKLQTETFSQVRKMSLLR
ncbi:MAG: hypothetical protein DWQ10_01650 [Calditrichaeota bacterium]|nr:MAG: hypothetical protein DWQ10_01650 [Calditrichota bacterium]